MQIWASSISGGLNPGLGADGSKIISPKGVLVGLSYAPWLHE